MKIELPKLKRYHVYNPNGNCISTDDLYLAERKAILCNGTVYEDTRYKGRKRLQRCYFKAIASGKEINELMYPELIKISQ